MKITVVGAGVVGCAVAYELASRGASVTIIDSRGPGQGATQASAGILAPYLEGHTEPLLALSVASLALYDRFVARVSADASLPIEYKRTGTLQAARDDAGARTLDALARVLAGASVEHTLVDGAGARTLERALSGEVTAGLLIPGHGYVRVASLMAALAVAAANHGAHISLAHVKALDRREGHIRIDTSEGMMSADVVVMAAGCWSAGIPMTPAAPVPVRPVRGQLLHLRLPSPPFSRVVWGGDCYLVPWEDGSVLVGATVEEAGFDESATVAGVQQLLGCASDLLPDVRSARFEDVRVGLRPATRDELPVIGASSTMRDVYYATGHYRGGVLLAPLTAVLVADLILDGRERPELQHARPDRFDL